MVEANTGFKKKTKFDKLQEQVDDSVRTDWEH